MLRCYSHKEGADHFCWVKPQGMFEIPIHLTPPSTHRPSLLHYHHHHSLIPSILLCYIFLCTFSSLYSNLKKNKQTQTTALKASEVFMFTLLFNRQKWPVVKYVFEMSKYYFDFTIRSGLSNVCPIHTYIYI